MSFDGAIQEFAANLQQVVPAFVLVFFRVAGMMIFAPLFGSARIPRRVKGLMAVIIALGIAPGVAMPHSHSADDLGARAWASAARSAFGLAMGTVLCFIFIATQWAGEMIGQQMGFNISRSLDPQFGAASSVIGDLYFMLTLIIFLAVGGHRALLIGVRDSFDCAAAAFGRRESLAFRSARSRSSPPRRAWRFNWPAPMLVTMLVVDLSLGCIGKTMPQIERDVGRADRSARWWECWW